MHSQWNGSLASCLVGLLSRVVCLMSRLVEVRTVLTFFTQTDPRTRAFLEAPPPGVKRVERQRETKETNKQNDRESEWAASG